MRKEIGAIVIGVGIEVILFFLSKQFEEIPIFSIIIGYIIGGLFILYGVICFIAPINRIWEVMMKVRFRLPFFLHNQGDIRKEKTKVPSWIQQVLVNDKSELGKRIHIHREQWFFGHINDTEPFMEVIIQIVNATVFPILLEGVEGSFQIQETKCNWDATMIHSRIPHGEAGNIRITQRLLKETVEKMVKLHNERDGFMVELNNCCLVIQAEEPDVENKPTKVPIQIREQVRINT